MRPIMTADELRAHRVGTHGRDYSRSDDGYGDMEAAAEDGWSPVAGWGRDGWDLGNWPYVAISLRERRGLHEVLSVVEGDHDIYAFETVEDRNAAVDYLFVWHGLGREYDEWAVEGLTLEKRSALDAGTLRVPEKFRGPVSWSRVDAAAGTDAQ